MFDLYIIQYQDKAGRWRFFGLRHAKEHAQHFRDKAQRESDTFRAQKKDQHGQDWPESISAAHYRVMRYAPQEELD